jgi:hypothetical protein
MAKTFGDQPLPVPRSPTTSMVIERRCSARALNSIREKRQALPNELFGSFHTSFDKKSDRLLVANPTIWQGFSLHFEV